MHWKGQNAVRINKATLIQAMQFWLRDYVTRSNDYSRANSNVPIVTDVKVLSDKQHNFHGIEIVVIGDQIENEVGR